LLFCFVLGLFNLYGVGYSMFMFICGCMSGVGGGFCFNGLGHVCGVFVLIFVLFLLVGCSLFLVCGMNG
jgi:hypothetical protein